LFDKAETVLGASAVIPSTVVRTLMDDHLWMSKHHVWSVTSHPDQLTLPLAGWEMNTGHYAVILCRWVLAGISHKCGLNIWVASKIVNTCHTWTT